MSIHESAEEYALALRQGQKEYRERMLAGLDPYPAVLDELADCSGTDTVVDVGYLEIPADRIVGTKTAGRISAFTANFQPLLSADSEFARKWINLCHDHLESDGIREPILCYEYLGYFYVQEGNKRVSVLKHFGAPRIPGFVLRVMPAPSEEPRIRAYYEFLEFYKTSRLYTLQFRRPGDYAKLLSHLGKPAAEEWTERERRTFSAGFQHFRKAFDAIHTKNEDILPEEALLAWLQLYPFQDLSSLPSESLKKTLAAVWEDLLGEIRRIPVAPQTSAEPEARPGILSRIISSAPDHLNVAFVHQMSTDSSTWALGHDDGRRYLEESLGDQVTVRSYFHADTPEQAEALLEQAVAEGAQVVFTTAPLLSRSTLKIAVKYPRVRFLNCSVDQPYSSFRTYYGRIFEAKFITGAIAGAIAQNDRIGYIASYPIFGVPASINAFALGAQLTNPRAQIELGWSCVEGSSQADFFRNGIRVVSNRDVPAQGKHLEFCNYGTYLMDDLGDLISLASPIWVWGRFYELVCRAILSGRWRDEKANPAPVNYWLGMDSGVIDISLSPHLPEGVRTLAELLRQGIRNGTIDPFFRRVVAQHGIVKNDGSRSFTPTELLQMDWLCDNVVGLIPSYDQILPRSRATVRELGIYRDRILTNKEGGFYEDFNHIR